MCLRKNKTKKNKENKEKEAKTRIKTRSLTIQCYLYAEYLQKIEQETDNREDLRSGKLGV